MNIFNPSTSTFITQNCKIDRNNPMKYTGQMNKVSLRRQGSGRLVCANGDSIESDHWANSRIAHGATATLKVCQIPMGQKTRIWNNILANQGTKCKTWTGPFVNSKPYCTHGFDDEAVECRCGPGKHFDTYGECTDEYSSPKGIISMWYGQLDDIPRGWALCDGNNETPDLRNRFVLGSGGNGPGGYSSHQRGGAATHTLTVAEMPSHTHRNPNEWLNGAYGGQDYGTKWTRPFQITSNNYQGRSPVSQQMAVGGNQAHNNMPPYYTLAYIMKLQND